MMYKYLNTTPFTIYLEDGLVFFPFEEKYIDSILPKIFGIKLVLTPKKVKQPKEKQNGTTKN